MLIGRTSLLAISTLTSEINFYTRLIKMKDPTTMEPMFSTFCVELACEACKELGKQVDCKHMLHLVPAWQSSQKHVRLKTIMQDRPDLIQSELSGLAFDALQQAFRKADLDKMFEVQAPPVAMYGGIFIFIDPAAGGPTSDYAILSVMRWRGLVTVSFLLLYLSLSDSGYDVFFAHDVDKVVKREALVLYPVGYEVGAQFQEEVLQLEWSGGSGAGDDVGVLGRYVFHGNIEGGC
jgi:hypothetical protein